MGRYEQRFTFQKIKSRYELIKKKYIRFSESISPLKCYFHQNASEKPLMEIAVDDSEWEVLVPPCYWGKWNANFTLRGKFTVSKDWQEYGQSDFEFNIGKTPTWDFEHPEALLFIDGKEIAGVDRNHTIGSTFGEQAKRKFTLRSSRYL